MAQSFSMSHGAANMSAAVTGMRHDAMGNVHKWCHFLNKFIFIPSF